MGAETPSESQLGRSQQVSVPLERKMATKSTRYRWSLVIDCWMSLLLWILARPPGNLRTFRAIVPRDPRLLTASATG